MCFANTSTCEDSGLVDYLQNTMTITYFGVEQNVSSAAGLGSCQPLDFHITKCHPGSLRCSRSWCIVGSDCKLNILHADSNSVSGQSFRYSFETCYDNAQTCLPEKSKTWHGLDYWCGYDISAVAASFVLGILVLVTCLFVLRLSCFIMSLRRCGLFHWLFSCLRTAWRSLASSDSDGQLTAQAKQLAEQWRIQRARSSMDFFGVLGYILLLVAVTYLLMSADYFNRDAYLRHAHTGVAAIRMLAVMPIPESAMIVSLSLVCGSQPNFCTAKLLDACMAFFGLASAARPLFFVIDYDYFSHGLLLWLLRFTLSLCWGNSKLNIMFATAASISAVLNKFLTDFPVSQGLGIVAIREFALLTSFSALLSGASWHTAKSAKFHVQFQVTDQQFNIITTLLDSLCDAVIRLDSDLCLLNPEPKLEALLQASPGFLQRRCFLELLPADESDRARKALLHGSHHSVGCLHTTMLDSNGLQVRVQVFHVCMHSPTEGVLHIAGVKEYSSELLPSSEPAGVAELGSLISSDALPTSSGSNQAPHPPLEDFEADFEADFFTEGSSVTSVSVESCPGSSTAVNEDAGVNEVWLDCTPELELLVIYYRTPSFSRMLGVSKSKKLKLAQYMTVGGYDDFRKWIHSGQESAMAKSQVVWLYAGKEQELTRFLVRSIANENAMRFGYVMRASYVGFQFEHAPVIQL